MKLTVLKNHQHFSELSLEAHMEKAPCEFYIGRAPDCHICINDPLISRHHFVLRKEASVWYCYKKTNLGSVTLNGLEVEKNQVRNGDEIKFGSYSMVISGLFDELNAKDQGEWSDNSGLSLDSESSENIDYLNNTEEQEESLEESLSDMNQQDDVSFQENLDQVESSSFENPSEEDISPGVSDDPFEGASLEDETRSDLDDLQISNEETSYIDNAQNLNNDQLMDEGFTSDDASQGIEDSESLDSESIDFTMDGLDASENFDDSEEGTKLFKTFVKYQLVLFGDNVPYDRFQIDQEKVIIGRDPKKCDIVLDDPEVSQEHAVIKKYLNEVILEDLNSSNGTVFRGERINSANLSVGDEFLIGGTSFTLEVRSDLLESEQGRLMPVESNQVIETEEVVEEEVAGDEGLEFGTDSPPEKSIFKRFKNDPSFRKKAIISLIIIVGVIFLIPDEDEKKTSRTDKKNIVKKNEVKTVKKLSSEQEKQRNVSYELGVGYFEQGRYDLAKREFEKVVSIDPEYKRVKAYVEQTETALKRIQELEDKKRLELERIRIKKEIDELLVKARKSFDEKNILVVESYLSQIIEKDPENIEASQLKLEVDSWKKAKEQEDLARAAKEAARKKMVDALSPGKTFYLKKEWSKAILKLEDFLRIKAMDEDLIKEASEMLGDAKNQLLLEITPLLQKSRSLSEGQDLKAAYEAYLEVLRIEPTNPEALNEIANIKEQLNSRSKKVYREAIISESLSLFKDAREKFLEVQQISPTDSEYYQKATDKLKNYLE